MKIPVLPAVVLLSVLALHSAQGAALASSEEETTIGNYAAGPEAFNAQFLNIDKLRSTARGQALSFPEVTLFWSLSLCKGFQER
ncbi:keratinocyte differentiation-associated protein isoform X3 [Odocoileus virginianus]|uniref:Keratinocyte differentiation-associated protein isoform X3 n=1 Tax=Odocoileus virginianus TaxID=9874 RepID=A0ABM4GXC5_ODOVR